MIPIINQFNNLTTPHEIIERMQTCFTQNDDNIFRCESVFNPSMSEKDADEEEDLHDVGNHDTVVLCDCVVRDIITIKERQKMTMLSLKM